jgi:hypothetical protein
MEAERAPVSTEGQAGRRESGFPRAATGFSPLTSRHRRRSRRRRHHPQHGVDDELFPVRQRLGRLQVFTEKADSVWRLDM